MYKAFVLVTFEAFCLDDSSIAELVATRQGGIRLFSFVFRRVCLSTPLVLPNMWQHVKEVRENK
jgi:hypothetical protein